MHTYTHTGTGTAFHYDPDLSGEVFIAVGMKEMAVPGRALAAFIQDRDKCEEEAAMTTSDAGRERFVGKQGTEFVFEVPGLDVIQIRERIGDEKLVRCNRAEILAAAAWLSRAPAAPAPGATETARVGVFDARATTEKLWADFHELALVIEATPLNAVPGAVQKAEAEAKSLVLAALTAAGHAQGLAEARATPAQPGDGTGLPPAEAIAGTMLFNDGLMVNGRTYVGIDAAKDAVARALTADRARRAPAQIEDPAWLTSPESVAKSVQHRHGGCQLTELGMMIEAIEMDRTRRVPAQPPTPPQPEPPRVRCFRHKDGFTDATDRIRFYPDGKVERVTDDGKVGILSYYRLAYAEESVAKGDWLEVPDAPASAATEQGKPRWMKCPPCQVQWNEAGIGRSMVDCRCSVDAVPIPPPPFDTRDPGPLDHPAPPPAPPPVATVRGRAEQAVAEWFPIMQGGNRDMWVERVEGLLDEARREEHRRILAMMTACGESAPAGEEARP